VSSTSLSRKEKKKESPSLEDQNAAAVQCIVDAKISGVTHNQQSEKEAYTSTVDTQTVNTASAIDISQGRLSHSSNQLIKDTSATVGSLQKETNQTSGFSGRSVSAGSSNPTEMCGEVILLEGNLMFLDSNASFSLNTETGSNFVSNPTPLATQLSSPLVMTSQPSVYKTGTSQVMTITIPGNSDAHHSAARLTEVPFYPTPERAVPQCLVATSVSQAVGSFAFPGSQNVNSAVQEQAILPMSTVIMCGNDGLIPHFISLPQQEPGKCVAVVTSDCEGTR
jgi:hypothetical protein